MCQKVIIIIIIKIVNTLTFIVCILQVVIMLS